MSPYRVYSLREAAEMFGATRTKSQKKCARSTDRVLTMEKLEDKLNVLFVKQCNENETPVYIKQKSQIFRGRFNITRVIEREEAIGLAIVKKEKKNVAYGKFSKTTHYITYDLIFNAGEKEKAEQTEKSRKYITLGEVINRYKRCEVLT